jgi:hypothetical protein
MYFIPPEGELFPEWRIVFIIAYPGPENYYKIIISLDEVERIINSSGWIIVDHHYFNKEKCESFRFDTEITQDGGMSWHSYTPEKASEFLAQELKTELGSQGVLTGMGMGVMGQSSMEEVFRKLMSNKPKTGQ